MGSSCLGAIMFLKGSVAEHSPGFKRERERQGEKDREGEKRTLSFVNCSSAQGTALCAGQTNLTVGQLSAQRDQTSVIEHM